MSVINAVIVATTARIELCSMGGRLDWRSSRRPIGAGVCTRDIICITSLLSHTNRVIRTSMYARPKERPIHRHLSRRDHYPRGSKPTRGNTHSRSGNLPNGPR